MHVQAKLCHGILPPIWYKNYRNESFANEATNATQNDGISWYIPARGPEQRGQSGKTMYENDEEEGRGCGWA